MEEEGGVNSNGGRVLRQQMASPCWKQEIDRRLVRLPTVVKLMTSVDNEEQETVANT